MKCQCPVCQVAFSVPDEKIPEGKTLKILCPKCRSSIELKGTCENVSLDRMNKPGEEGAPGTVPKAESSRSDDSMLDMIEEGQKTALLCISDSTRASALSQVLRELEYFVIHAPKVAVAVGKLRINRYDIVLLDESYDGSKPSENVLLQHIQLLPMHVRRQFFMCFLSESFATHDRLLAFRLGVDMILNVREMNRLKVMLVNAVKDHKAFYRVFNDELSRKG